MPAAFVALWATHLQVVVLLLLLILASCVNVPQGRTTLPPDPVEVPAAWSAGDVSGGAATPLAQWWTRFDDALLSDLVTQAVAANTSVATARANVLQSRALRDLASAALWPSLSGSASVQQGSAGGHSTGRQLDAGLSASWVPDIFGANRQALASASATLEASLADAGSSEVAVASEVGLAYILLRASQARLVIARDNLASQEDTLQITAWREQAGLATELDTAQARTAVEQTRALVPALNTAIDEAAHAIAVLTGHVPAFMQQALSTGLGIPNADPALTVSIPADTLRQRADVRAAGLRVSAALAQVSRAEAARFPGFALTGSVGLGASGVGALFQSSAVLSNLLASAVIPLFDGGAARAEVRLQQALVEQSRSAYRAAVLLALQQVEDALIALAGDRARFASLRLAADAATQAAQMSRQRFASGLIDFQVVLQTQRTQLQTQDGLALAAADVSSDVVRLYVALGGGWQEELAGTEPTGTESASPQTGWVWSR